MARIFISLLIVLIFGAGCHPKSIPETKKGRQNAERIHKRQYEMHPSYKKKKR